MDPTVRDRLRALFTREGDSICKSPKAAEAFLRDLCPSHKREISVLVGVVKLGIARKILTMSDHAITLSADRWVKQLDDDLGMAPEYAVWAIESWTFALGKPCSLMPRDSTVDRERKTQLDSGKIPPIIESKSAEEWYELGENHAQAKSYYKAIDAFEEAVSKDSGQARYRYALGVMYYKIDCHGQARKAFLEAVRLDPRYKSVRVVSNLIGTPKKH